MTLFDNFSSEFIKSISLYWEEPHSSLGAFVRSTRTKNSLLSPMQNSFCSTNQIDSVKIYIAPLEGAAITENNYQYSKSKWIFVISSHFKLYEQGITAELLGILDLEFNSHCNHENSYISFDVILDLFSFSRSFV